MAETTVLAGANAGRFGLLSVYVGGDPAAASKRSQQ